MNESTEKPLLLARVLPAFAAELRQLLAEQGEHELASQVPALAIADRCRCGDDFCATFYTQPKTKDGFGPGHRNVRLMPEEAMLILDVVDGEIACVEVLDRADVREKLDVVCYAKIPSVSSSGGNAGFRCFASRLVTPQLRA
jgi:hypothetical protein